MKPKETGKAKTQNLPTEEQRWNFLEKIYADYEELNAQQQEIAKRKREMATVVPDANKKKIFNVLFSEDPSDSALLGDWETYERVEHILKKFVYSRTEKFPGTDTKESTLERIDILNARCEEQEKYVASLQKTLASTQEELAGLMKLLRMKDDEIKSVNRKFLLEKMKTSQRRRESEDYFTGNRNGIFEDMSMLIQVNKTMEQENAKLRAALRAKSFVESWDPESSLSLSLPEQLALMQPLKISSRRNSQPFVDDVRRKLSNVSNVQPPQSKGQSEKEKSEVLTRTGSTASGRQQDQLETDKMESIISYTTTNLMKNSIRTSALVAKRPPPPYRGKRRESLVKNESNAPGVNDDDDGRSTTSTPPQMNALSPSTNIGPSAANNNNNNNIPVEKLANDKLRRQYIRQEVPVTSLLMKLHKERLMWRRRLEGEVANCLSCLDYDARVLPSNKFAPRRYSGGNSSRLRFRRLTSRSFGSGVSFDFPNGSTECLGHISLPNSERGSKANSDNEDSLLGSSYWSMTNSSRGIVDSEAGSGEIDSASDNMNKENKKENKKKKKKDKTHSTRGREPQNAGAGAGGGRSSKTMTFIEPSGGGRLSQFVGEDEGGHWRSSLRFSSKEEESKIIIEKSRRPTLELSPAKQKKKPGITSSVSRRPSRGKKNLETDIQRRGSSALGKDSIHQEGDENKEKDTIESRHDDGAVVEEGGGGGEEEKLEDAKQLVGSQINLDNLKRDVVAIKDQHEAMRREMYEFFRVLGECYGALQRISQEQLGFDAEEETAAFISGIEEDVVREMVEQRVFEKLKEHGIVLQRHEGPSSSLTDEQWAQNQLYDAVLKRTRDKITEAVLKKKKEKHELLQKASRRPLPQGQTYTQSQSKSPGMIAALVKETNLPGKNTGSDEWSQMYNNNDDPLLGVFNSEMWPLMSPHHPQHGNWGNDFGAMNGPSGDPTVIRHELRVPQHNRLGADNYNEGVVSGDPYFLSPSPPGGGGGGFPYGSSERRHMNGHLRFFPINIVNFSSPLGQANLQRDGQFHYDTSHPHPPKQFGGNILEYIRSLQPRKDVGDVKNMAPMVYRYDFKGALSNINMKIKDTVRSVAEHLREPDFENAFRSDILPYAKIAKSLQNGQRMPPWMLAAIRQLRAEEEKRNEKMRRFVFKRVATNLRARRLLRSTVCRGSAIASYVIVLWEKWLERWQKKRATLRQERNADLSRMLDLMAGHLKNRTQQQPDEVCNWKELKDPRSDPSSSHFSGVRFPPKQA